MPLDREVSNALPPAPAASVPTLNWWQRTALIVFANAVGVLLGGGLLAYQGILWQKSNATDSIREDLKLHKETSLITRVEIMSEIAFMKATISNLQTVRAVPATPMIPEEEESLASLPEAPPLAPSADQVETAKEEIQQKIDKALYRQKQLRD